MSNISNRNTNVESSVYLPKIYRLSSEDEKKQFQELLNDEPNLSIYNTILAQLKELVACRNPQKVLSKEEINEQIEVLLNGTAADDFGTWVYYPWSKRLVHILDEQEFIELRTNRNFYKITPQEQAVLSQKKVGIIGLSVGQSVAVTLAMERLAGELRLADFDELDLSNYNRIRTGLYNIGLKKTVATAREIAEIDPFIKITCFHNGITAENIEDFISADNKLDVLVDECDSIDIKLLCRLKARQAKIPVIMDTSDRGMLDIERFDLEPERPILHGMIEGVDPETLSKLSPQERLPYVMKLIDVQGLSDRSKYSLSEIGKSIKTWPQLASSVVMGGGMAAEMIRKILLKESNTSGRFFIDLDKLIA